jgi:MFS family permease
MVLFEVPTGVVADTWGRRASYLLGTLTLAGSTALYWLLWQTEAAFWAWALVSILIGLGFTFFSGAVEAWLVDALRYAGYEGELESVFGKGQMVMGAAMLGGSVAGGVIAQVTNLGVPFLLRVLVLVAMFAVAWTVMRDLGFTPQRSRTPLQDMRHVLSTSIEHGLGNPPVRWVMLAAPFTAGVGIYTFYALQPFLLELYGDPNAYSIAGLAAAILAGAQIVGGWLAPRFRGLFARRTTALLLAAGVTSLLLAVLALTESFAVALAVLVAWGLMFAMQTPIRQAYLNGMIPSERRATVLSFDSLMGNSGGVVIQPVLGRAADVWSYGTSYAVGGAFQALALPFLWLSRREDDASDMMRTMTDETLEPASA